MDESILSSIKQLVGVDKDFDGFDEDVLVAINSSFAILRQLGVFDQLQLIDSKTAWSDVVDEERFVMCKNYVHLKTQLIFDPPQTSFAIDAKEKLIAEIEWRLNSEADYGF